MAHHTATKKSIRQIAKRNERNTARRSRTRTSVKQVESAVEAGDLNKAQEALKLSQKELMRSVSKGVMKMGTASRKLSRLNAKVKLLAAAGK